MEDDNDPIASIPAPIQHTLSDIIISIDISTKHILVEAWYSHASMH